MHQQPTNVIQEILKRNWRNVDLLRTLILSALLSAFLLVSAVSARAEHTRVTVPDVVGVEVLGRTTLWSLTYDRVLSDELAAGFGFGTSGTKTLGGVDTGNSAQFVPVYVNYYFMPEQGSAFLTGGVSVVLNSNTVSAFQTTTGNLELPSSSVVPTFGLGYENRSEVGFLVRGTLYGLVGDNFAPWFGFHFGYAF